MKRSFVAFWRRNLGFAKLGIITNTEYRLNFFVDAVVQPAMTSAVEIFLWIAIFKGAQAAQINGFGESYYLSYALWSAFFARLAASWMYESRMIAEIDLGTINGLLVRPTSFYEYYFSQLMGYKFITTVASMMAPLLLAYFLSFPTQYERIPVAILLCSYYLVLVHSISFIIASCAFFLNKIYSFTAAKNMILWVLTGELFPLDLVPDGLRQVFIALPFSSGVYLPVAYITGRVEFAAIKQGFVSVTIGIVVANIVGAWIWKKGLRTYSGTGA